ncbi:thermostable hemolysin [Pseudomonas fluorescens]|uniref:thermostable hemolysin n=1 Tax=Pseudomonas fluorescens TaxID=294 RepID=UPI001785A9EB|nr:thermostable hemolysin [Pseudomonas fluorescens]
MRAHLVKRQSPQWSAAQEFVKLRYKNAYGAVIAPSPDYFLVVSEDEKSIQACAGIWFAGEGKLFSENYINENCEKILSGLETRRVERSTVAEIGSVASVNSAAGRCMFKMLSVVSWCLGARYLLCTSNPRSIQVMMQCKVNFVPICSADMNRAPRAEGITWGSYYDDQPITGYIRLNEMESHYRETMLHTEFHLQPELRSIAS